MHMKRNDKTFKEMVSRIQSGELTRIKAAEVYNVKAHTLNVWIARSKLDVPKQKPKAYGAAAELDANLDPTIAKLLEEAAQKVLDGTFKSCLAAHKEYQDLSLSTLTARVRKARLAQGLPIGRQGKKIPAPTTSTPLTIARNQQELSQILGFEVITN